MTFQSIGLSPVLCRTLSRIGYSKPTPVQASAIPVVMSGRDLHACAQTGTGKTAAFALPIIDRITGEGAANGRGRKSFVRVLVLTPTRELAEQVNTSFRRYGGHAGLRTTAIYGGTRMSPQVSDLRRGVDVVVATPGRLIDHMEQRTIDLSKVEILTLDEADRMLDMGFLPALKRIIGKLPVKRQTLLFSATLSGEVQQLAGGFMHEPEKLELTSPNSVAQTVTHRVHPVDKERKRELLEAILADGPFDSALVFCRTRHGSDRLTHYLEKRGFRVAAIHGDKSQGQRNRALSNFKNGRVDVLVATDVAARGLDIQQLPVVINFDLPQAAADYIHRIGRTGRAGLEGHAISLASHEDQDLLREIAKLLKQELVMENVVGFEPKRPFSAVPRRKASAPTGRGKGRARKFVQQRRRNRTDAGSESHATRRHNHAPTNRNSDRTASPARAARDPR